MPEKNIKLLQGGCPTHVRMSKRDVEKARKAHPDALLLVHPECLPEVSGLADYRGSTTGIMDYAKKSDAKEFIIGTENSIVQHLQFACPDKQFYPLSRDCVCHNMKLTTLGDVYQCVKGTGGEEIKLDEEVRNKANADIDTMLELGQLKQVSLQRCAPCGVKDDAVSPQGAKVCGKRTLYFLPIYKGIQCNRCGGITGKERVRFSAGELWTTDYKRIIGFGRGIGKQHPGYQIVVVSVLKTIYEERKGKLKRI